MNNSTQTINKQIISLRKKGITFREIAERLSVTYDKVRYVCRKEGVSSIRYERTCLRCNKEFKAERATAKFCDETCRSRYNKAKNNYGNTTKNCRWCGNEFKTYSASNKAYCSDECNKAEGIRRHKEKLRNRTIKLYRLQCKECEQTFFSRTRRTFCNKACDTKYRYWNVVRPRQLEESDKVCIVCGDKITEHLGANVCSDKCRKIHKRNVSRAREKRRYRKAKDNGKIEWDINLEDLIKRDNNVCHLCGGECDKADHVINDKGHFITGDSYPSIDHVTPVSKGGTHTWDNVKLAHFRCNYLKGDNENL